MPDAMTNPYSHASTYQRDEILTASPVRLVVRVLGGAMTALRRARLLLAAGEGPRARHELGRAYGLVAELLGALDRKAGGEIAARLNSLYEYILTQLLRPGTALDLERIQLAEELLRPIKEGFDTIVEQQA